MNIINHGWLCLALLACSILLGDNHIEEEPPHVRCPLLQRKIVSVTY